MIKVTRICDKCKREFEQLNPLEQLNAHNEVSYAVSFECSDCILQLAERLTPTAREKAIEDILNRMHNWKMRQAYEKAKTLFLFLPQDTRKEVLYLLEEAANTFEDCGWQDGTIFNWLRTTNHQIALLMGYAWDNEKDKWVKR